MSVPQPMDAVNAGLRRLRLDEIELILVRHLDRDQAARAARLLGFLNGSPCTTARIGMSRSLSPSVQLAFKCSTSPRSAQVGCSLMLSLRRSPKASCKRGDKAV